MTAKARLFISRVIHEAYVEVNEEGTEAAASTAAMITRGISVNAFVVDHPFMFLIRDNRSGCNIFMGRVTNPPEEGGAATAASRALDTES